MIYKGNFVKNVYEGYFSAGAFLVKCEECSNAYITLLQMKHGSFLKVLLIYYSRINKYFKNGLCFSSIKSVT